MSILCQLNANFRSKGFYIGLSSSPPPFWTMWKTAVQYWSGHGSLVCSREPCFLKKKTICISLSESTLVLTNFFNSYCLSPFFHFGQQNAGYRGSQEEVPITFDFAKRGLTGLCRGERDNDMNIKGRSFGGILAQKRKSPVAVFEKFKTFWHTWLSFK